MLAIKILGVSICFKVVVHAVTKLVPKTWCVCVVVIRVSGLMSEGIIKGDIFIHIGITVPDIITFDFRARTRTLIHPFRCVVGKGVSAIEHGHAIYKKPNTP